MNRFLTLFYGLLAGIFVGTHVFSVKYIQMRFAYNTYTLGLIASSFCLWVLSRVFLILSYQYTGVSLFSHLFLLVGILVSIVLDDYILNKPIRSNYVYLGMGFVLMGFILIAYHSY